MSTHQWRCVTCNHPVKAGEHCYLPWCVDARIQNAKLRDPESKSLRDAESVSVPTGEET